MATGIEKEVQRIMQAAPRHLQKMSQLEKATDHCFKSVNVAEKQLALLNEEAGLNKKLADLQMQVVKGDSLMKGLLEEAKGKLSPEAFIALQAQLAEVQARLDKQIQGI